MQHVILKDSPTGKGVFAIEAIEKNEVIMLFRGEIVLSEYMQNPYPEYDDHDSS
jgi:hypothetical protein